MTDREKKQIRRDGFTLVEMLMAVAVIVILVCIMVPVISIVRASARSAMCQAHERILMNAFLLFAADHDNHLPGNFWDSIYQQPSDPTKRDWLLGDDPHQGNEGLQFLDGPQKGTIFPYVRDPSIYLCPEYQAVPFNTNYGSNGRFDYAAFMMFSGAQVCHVSSSAQFRFAGNVESNYPTPVICEEEPSGGVNGGNVEGGHNNFDRLAHYHRGGAYYASVDGSVHWFKEPLTANAWNWYSLAPSRQYVTLGTTATSFGYWDHK